MSYGHEMHQAAAAAAAAGTMYNRQMTELQNVVNVDKNAGPVQPDKKTKRRKTTKNGTQ